MGAEPQDLWQRCLNQDSNTMPRADEFIAKSKVQETILSFYTLLMKKEFDQWGELFTEDAVQENPFMPLLPGLDATFAGRERIVFHYKTVLTGRRGHVFTVDEIYEAADGSTVIVEVGGRSEVPETGRIYDQRYVMIFKLVDGKIARVREYFNPLVFQNAFEGFLVGQGAVKN
jgi:ketosteroid isomerase-like protein